MFVPYLSFIFLSSYHAECLTHFQNPCACDKAVLRCPCPLPKPHAQHPLSPYHAHSLIPHNLLKNIPEIPPTHIKPTKTIPATYILLLIKYITMKYFLLTSLTLLTLSTYSQDFKAVNETKYMITDSGMIEVYYHKQNIRFYLTPQTLIITRTPTSDYLGSSDTLEVKSLVNIRDKIKGSKKQLFTKIITYFGVTVLVWDTHVSLQYPVVKKTKSSLLYLFDRP
jgi:hypothetical protein